MTVKQEAVRLLGELAAQSSHRRSSIWATRGFSFNVRCTAADAVSAVDSYGHGSRVYYAAAASLLLDGDL